MLLLADIVQVVGLIFFVLLIARLVLDYIFMFARDYTPHGFVLVLAEIVFTITDPPLRFVRRFVPPLRLGGISLDLAFSRAPPRRPDRRRGVPAQTDAFLRVTSSLLRPLTVTLASLGVPMPLTASDVANKQFTTVKLREGYNMEEVDSFLDEVEAELGRLHREIDDLTAGRCRRGAPIAAPAPVEVVVAPAPVPVPAPAAAPTDAAVRMLELAQKTADEHVNAAKAEAERILADARATHQRTMGDLESERASMQAKVDELRSFEKEYRTRLRSYLEGQLRDLDAKAALPPARRRPQLLPRLRRSHRPPRLPPPRVSRRRPSRAHRR